MKNKLSITLVLALLAAQLTSCGDQTQQPETTSNADDGTTTPSETTEYIDTLPIKDFDSEKFVIIGQSYSGRQNFYMEELDGDVRNDALHERDTAVSERLGIKLEYVAVQERSDVTSMVQQSVLAGDESYNLVFNSLSAGINTLTSGGFLYDLKDIPYLSLESELW